MNITGLLRSLQVASVVTVVQVPEVPIAKLFKPLLVRASKFVKRCTGRRTKATKARLVKSSQSQFDRDMLNNYFRIQSHLDRLALRYKLTKRGAASSWLARRHQALAKLLLKQCSSQPGVLRDAKIAASLPLTLLDALLCD